MTTVSVPQAMDPAWVGEATEYTLERYAHYYASHKLEAGSEGWTSWLGRHVAKKTIGLIHIGSSWILPGYAGKAVELVHKQELPYKAAAVVAEQTHAAFVAKTRQPIDHDRVLKVVAKLGLIQKCTNCEGLFERLQKEYTKWYLASKASSDLMQTLSAKDESPEAKVQATIAYLTRAATLSGFEDIYYNNGKKLYQMIICLTEQATLGNGQ